MLYFNFWVKPIFVAMIKAFPFFLCLPLITACLSTSGGQGASEFEGYFTDATECYQTSIHKEQVKVQTGKAVTVIDIPTVHNAGAFSNCMARAGHTPPKVNPQAYLEMSSRCLNEARGTEQPDEAYARCIRAGTLRIEPILDEKSE